MVATNAALASGGITHCCLRCGLRMFFLASARSCCRWRARQCAVRQPSPRADAGSIWQSPSGTGESVSAISFASAAPSKIRRRAELDCICGPTPPRTLPRPAGAWCRLDSGDAGVQRRGDPAVAPAFARIRYVRFQQDARLRQQLGGKLAFSNQLSSRSRSSASSLTTYFLTAISFPATNHLHRCLAATEIKKFLS